MKNIINLACLSLMTTVLFSQTTALDHLSDLRPIQSELEFNKEQFIPRSLTQAQSEDISQQLDSTYWYEDDVLMKKNFYTYYPNHNIHTVNAVSWNDEIEEFFVYYQEEYDEDGNQITNINSGVNNETGEQTYYGKTTHTYNSNNDIIESINFDFEDGAWLNISKSSYEYNDEHLRTAYNTYLWDGSEWINNTSVIHEYDNLGQITLTESKEWVSGEWLNKNQELNSYDDNGNLIEHLYKEWIVDQLVENVKVVHSYNSDNIEIENTQYKWEDAEWQLEYTSVFLYNDDGFLLVDSLMFWNGTSWIKNVKNEFNYDENNNCLNYSKFLGNDSVWFEYSKTIQEFVDNNLVSTSRYERNSEEEVLELHMTHELQFDFDYWMSQIATPYPTNWSYMNVINKILKYTRTVEEEASYINYDSGEYIYYYSDVETSVNEIADENCSVYPNPASDYIRVETEGLQGTIFELMDLNGRVIKTQCLDQNKIDIKSLTNGMYLYKITSIEAVKSGKIMINK